MAETLPAMADVPLVPETYRPVMTPTKISYDSTTKPDVYVPVGTASQKNVPRSQMLSHVPLKALQAPIPKPRTGSRSTEPFDAAELSRKLNSYRNDLKLDKARRAQADKAFESKAKLSRNDSANSDSESQLSGKDTNATTTAAAAAATARVRPTAPRKSSSTRNVKEHRKSRTVVTRARKPSWDASAPYVPRFAAMQFTSTTSPLRSTGQDEASHSSAHTLGRGTATTSRPTHPLDNDLDTDTAARDQRSRTANLFLAQANATIAGRTPAAPRNKHLSTAHEDSPRTSEDSENPYILSTTHHHDKDHDKHASLDAHSSDKHADSLRPTFQLGDRHDWSQQSQYGVSLRNSAQPHKTGHHHVFKKKDRAGEDAEMAGLMAALSTTEKGRKKAVVGGQKGQGEGGENMVAEAVKIVQQERRRSSILGLFKRH